MRARVSPHTFWGRLDSLRNAVPLNSFYNKGFSFCYRKWKKPEIFVDFGRRGGYLHTMSSCWPGSMSKVRWPTISLLGNIKKKIMASGLWRKKWPKSDDKTGFEGTLGLASEPPVPQWKFLRGGPGVVRKLPLPQLEAPNCLEAPTKWRPPWTFGTPMVMSKFHPCLVMHLFRTYRVGQHNRE